MLEHYYVKPSTIHRIRDSWLGSATHQEPLQRDFYAELCRVEGWSVSRLRQKIDSMLFERTALSRKPEKLARKELSALRADGKWMPDMVFRDPYILDFLNLSNSYNPPSCKTSYKQPD